MGRTYLHPDYQNGRQGNPGNSGNWRQNLGYQDYLANRRTWENTSKAQMPIQYDSSSTSSYPSSSSGDGGILGKIASGIGSLATWYVDHIPPLSKGIELGRKLTEKPRKFSVTIISMSLFLGFCLGMGLWSPGPNATESDTHAAYVAIGITALVTAALVHWSKSILGMLICLFALMIASALSIATWVAGAALIIWAVVKCTNATH